MIDAAHRTGSGLKAPAYEPSVLRRGRRPALDGHIPAWGMVSTAVRRTRSCR